MLRAPRPSDVVDRLAAGRDPELRRMVGTRPSAEPLTRHDAERWYARLAGEPHGWVIDEGGRCVGEARLHHVDPAAGECWIALALFSPTGRGRGLGTDAVQLLLAYAFGALGSATVRLRVLAFNARAIACYRRCGFREVGREPVRLYGAEEEAAAEDILMAVTASAYQLTTVLSPTVAPPP